ncbi:MAG: MerR family transcriptional regulator [Chloroflexota bacterium]
MTVGSYLRTKDLAQAVNISVQQVRNYETEGFIPTVERSPSGYRRYTRRNLVALKAARHLIGGYGKQQAQQIMQAVHQKRISDALALIDERHAELARMRQQLEQTVAALNLLATQLPAKTYAAPKRLRVGAAAQLVGVRVSALRFWEQQGLLHPIREKSSRYRLYDEQQLHRLRIVALLRQANYDFPAIRTTLHELEAGQPQRAMAAIEQRRSTLTTMSWRCVEAMATLHAYIEEF